MGNMKTVTVTYSASEPTNPSFAPKSSTELNFGDTVTIKLAGNFPADSTIDKIEIVHNMVDGVEDKKDTNSPLGSWTAASGNGPGLNGFFSCSDDSSTQVKIEDTEITDDDDKYWYSASGAIGGTSSRWSIDPELINKGKARKA